MFSFLGDNSQFTAESMSYFVFVSFEFFMVIIKFKTQSSKYEVYGERKLGRPVDALALGGDEGRDKLR